MRQYLDDVMKKPNMQKQDIFIGETDNVSTEKLASKNAMSMSTAFVRELTIIKMSILIHLLLVAMQRGSYSTFTIGVVDQFKPG